MLDVNICVRTKKSAEKGMGTSAASLQKQTCLRILFASSPLCFNACKVVHFCRSHMEITTEEEDLGTTL